MNGDQLIYDLVKKLRTIPELSVNSSGISRKVYSLEGSLNGLVYLKAIGHYPHRWGITKNTVDKIGKRHKPWCIVLLYDSDDAGYVISCSEYRKRVQQKVGPFHQGDYKITEGKSLKGMPHFSSIEQLITLLHSNLTAPIIAEVAIEEAKKEAQRIRKSAGGESNAHKKLKIYVVENPASIGLAGVLSTFQEYSFPSGDQVHVAFESLSNHWTVVEIELQGLTQTLVGLFQAIKYKALQEAILKTKGQQGSVNGVLVANSIPGEVKSVAEVLGIKTFEVVI